MLAPTISQRCGRTCDPPSPAGEAGVRRRALRASICASPRPRGLVAPGAPRRRRRTCARCRRGIFIATGMADHRAPPPPRPGRPRRAWCHHRDAAGIEHRLGLDLVEHVAPAAQHLLPTLAHARQIRRRPAPAAPARLHQLRLVAPVGHQHREGAHRLLGRRSRRCRRRGRGAAPPHRPPSQQPMHARRLALASGTSSARAMSALGTMAVGACTNSTCPVGSAIDRFPSACRNGRPARRR